MQVTISFDMATTEYPDSISAAAARLMMAARGMNAPSVSDDAEVTREPAVGQEESLPTSSENVTTGKKRGRKSKAETDAENAALTAAVAEEAAAEPVPETEKVAFTPPTSTPPAMFTPNPAGPMATATFTTPSVSSPATSPFPSQASSPFPPAATSTVSAAAPTATVQAPAMPPPQEIVIGEGTTIEDVRAIMALANTKQPSAAFQFMRRETWLDGSPKGKWMTAEGIPADQRERYITELAQDAGL